MKDGETEQRKKRILFVSEASSLHTGFSNYNRILIPELVKTGKYDIAEFGSYVTDDNPGVKAFIKDRWKFYGGMPNNPEQQKEFEAANEDPAQPGQQLSQFGKWRFEKVVSDFKADIVCSNRDAWMDSFIARSPLRRYFQWIWLVIPDSVPQQEEWIHTYITCDYLACYSDFGINSIRKSSPHLELRFNPPEVDILGINQIGKSIDAEDLSQVKKPGKLHPIPLRPVVDTGVFKPANKQEIREKWGLKAENPVILLVQRNQERKRINEAIQAFALMKEKYAGNQAIDKAVMLLHTSWPDNAHSSDYPRCIQRTHQGYHGMPYSHKNIFAEVLNTFLCNNQACGHVFIAHAIHLREVGAHNNYCIKCPRCEQQSARPPNTSVGYTREQLAEVYGVADILLQMSIAEGEGMPCNEAKACGVVVLATDYAALSEKVKVPDYEHIDKKNYTMHLGGEPLKVAALYEEPATRQFRAHTSIEDAAEKMAKYLMNPILLKKQQEQAVVSVHKNYSKKELIKQWEFILDNKSIHDRDNTWDKPPRLIEIDMTDPSPDMPDDQFIDWCYTKLLGYAEDAIDQKGKQDWLQTLEIHRSQGKQSHEVRKTITDFFRNEANNLNNIERLRAGVVDVGVNKPPEDKDSISAMVII